MELTILSTSKIIFKRHNRRYCRILLFLIVLLTFGMSSFANTNINKIQFNLSSDGTYYWIEAKDKSIQGDLIIPSEYNGLPVKEISGEAFRSCPFITDVTIPNSIIDMAQYSFYDCPSIETVTYLSEYPAYGASSAFSYNVCNNAILKVPFGCIPTYIDRNWGHFVNIQQLSDNRAIEANLILEEAGSLISKIDITDIPNIRSLSISGPINGTDILVINRMPALERVDLSNAIIEDGGKSYYQYESTLYYTTQKLIDRFWFNSTYPTEVILPEASIIASGAFADSRIKRITLPNTLSLIGEEAFCGCKSLNNIFIPEKVNYIGEKAFLYCPNLHSVDVDATNISFTSIGGALFTKDLTSLIFFPSVIEGYYNIPYGVQRIGNFSFYNTSLRGIGIPNSVTTIGNSTFDGASNLETLIIGTSITTIEMFAFNWATSLKRIYCMNPTPPNLYQANGFMGNLYDSTLYVPEKSLNAYWLDYSWGKIKTIKGIEGALAAEIFPCNQIVNLNIGESKQLILDTISNDINSCNIGWLSSNPAIASVNELGVVTAVSPGSTNIIATCGIASATFSISVEPIQEPSIELNFSQLDITVGETVQLTAIVWPENTSVIWSSSDETIASIDESGMVEAINAGTAIITASCGTLSATCIINSQLPSSISNIETENSHELIIHTISGTRLETDYENLSPGFYIINGNKVFKK